MLRLRVKAQRLRQHRPAAYVTCHVIAASAMFGDALLCVDCLPSSFDCSVLPNCVPPC